MDHFVIDGFNFGVDSGRSSVVVKDGLLDLRLVGDVSVITDLIARDDHPWNWLIQPPFLFVLGLPCRVHANGDFDHEITEPELDDYDIALYAMEHCDVIPCRVSRKGNLVSVVGKVHGIRKAAVDFDVEWKVA